MATLSRPLLRRLSAIGASAVAVLAFTTTTAHAGPVTTADAGTVRADIATGSAAAKYGTDAACARVQLRCGVHVLTTAPGSATPVVTAAPAGYGPADFEAAYTPTGSGTGTIAIIDAGAYPTLESDLGVYRTQYGLPACTTANGCLTIKSYDGSGPMKPQTSSFGKQIEQQVSVETALDVQAASAACPRCKITEYQIPYLDATIFGEQQGYTDFGLAVNRAAQDGAKAVSISYGYDSDSSVLSGTIAKRFDHTGMAITVSSGDSGFISGSHSSWPASLSTVTAVGGTKLAKSGSTFSETVWNEKAAQRGAAGSGCELSTGPAVGQPTSVSGNCQGHRADTDISADADPATGYAVYDTYSTNPGWLVVGGTSASAPLIAGYYVRSNNTSGVHGPNTIYAAAASNFHDVTSGNNEYTSTCADNGTPQKVCTAGAGWDGPTGLGTPKGLGAL